jgi:hypothetical protein
VPENRETATVLGRPIEQSQHPRLGGRGRQPSVPLLGQRRIHHREWHLDQIGGLVPRDIPHPEWMCDPGTEAEGVWKAERGVIAEADVGERHEIPVRIGAEVVVAVPEERPVQLREKGALPREAVEVLGGEIAAVEADLGPCAGERLDELRAEPLVRLRRGAVGTVAVARHDEERRPRAVLALLGGDLREAPVRVAAAQPVERHAREAARLVERRPHAARESVSLQPRRSAEHADARPAPRHVHVVRQRDRECRVAVARCLQPELLPQPLERRVERV